MWFTCFGPVPFVSSAFLGSVSVFLGDCNAFIRTKVRNKIVLLETAMISGGPGTERLPGFFDVGLNKRWEFDLKSVDVSLSVNDIFVQAEIRNKVVNWMSLMGGWSPGKKGLSFGLSLQEPVILWEIPGTILCLVLLKMAKGIIDIVIESKVRNGISHIMGFGWGSPIPNVTKFTFGI